MAKPRRQTPIYENFCSRLSGVFISVSKNPPPFQRSRLVGISLGTTTNRHTRTSRASINTSLTSSRPVPCFVYGRVCLARTVKTVLPNNNECVGGWTGRIARRVPLSRVFLTQFRSSGSLPSPPFSLSLSPPSPRHFNWAKINRVGNGRAAFSLYFSTRLASAGNRARILRTHGSCFRDGDRFPRRRRKGKSTYFCSYSIDPSIKFFERNSGIRWIRKFERYRGPFAFPSLHSFRDSFRRKKVHLYVYLHIRSRRILFFLLVSRWTGGKGEWRHESRRDYMGREIAFGRPSPVKRCFRPFFDSFVQIEIFKRFVNKTIPYMFPRETSEIVDK